MFYRVFVFASRAQTGFYRVLLGFQPGGSMLISAVSRSTVLVQFYRVLPGYTGFLPSFTEFYRVLLGFTELN